MVGAMVQLILEAISSSFVVLNNAIQVHPTLSALISIHQATQHAPQLMDRQLFVEMKSQVL
jgi:hypothetical protein